MCGGGYGDGECARWTWGYVARGVRRARRVPGKEGRCEVSLVRPDEGGGSDALLKD